MNVLVIGAGRMAYGLVFDFLKNKEIKGITVIDNLETSCGIADLGMISGHQRKLQQNPLLRVDSLAGPPHTDPVNYLYPLHLLIFIDQF